MDGRGGVAVYLDNDGVFKPRNGYYFVHLGTFRQFPLFGCSSCNSNALCQYYW